MANKESSATRKTIKKFLDSVADSKTSGSCPTCGSPLKIRQAVFYYDGQAWEVPLPVCLKCLSGTENLIPPQK
jgi:hypothetical protein